MALFKKEGAAQTVVNQYNEAYASMLYALDENVGRLLEKIEALNLTDNTLVIFTSDNGGLTTLMAHRTAPTSVRPLRAGKGWAYEGGIRIPLLIKKPRSKAGK
ncbi:sulfatase-like hydrolase/transferase [Zobellia laminariae]|uniref:sulfatase-like hydrolase/transferase n=1 Tax=Zobellia laminariae TaxID=248906 RepID=UPI0026F41536|nr:sulfatase-like hydrolase/transferase [Zobellia laminariae]WKX76402.1 sulfatase-like hydrolase/transferase [Zobellia laminariae]